MLKADIKKKVYYFSNSNLESKQANSIHVLKMCSAFTKSNYEITLFTKKCYSKVQLDQKYGIKEKFPVIFTKWIPIRGVGGFLYGLINFIKVLKLGKPSIVYGRDLYSILFSILLFCKIRYESHEPPNNKIKYLIENYLFKLNQFEKLIVISNALKKIYMKKYPFLNSNNIIVAHDGSDEANENDFKISKLDKNSFPIKIGYIGSLYKGRGINIISDLAEYFPSIGFYIIGEKNERFNDIDLPNLFFIGFIDHRLVPSYLNQFEIVLAPYQEIVTLEGDMGDTSKFMSPLKIFEYMASGKAIIASDLPVIREVLQNEHNSLLCNPNDINQWKSAIEKLENSPMLRNSLGENAKKDLMDNYTWEKRVDKVMGDS